MVDIIISIIKVLWDDFEGKRLIFNTTVAVNGSCYEIYKII